MELAADLRAPTPSAAAELVVNSKMQMSADCAAFEQRLLLAMTRQLASAESQLKIQKLSLKDPELLIERFMQCVDDLQLRSEEALVTDIESSGQVVKAATVALMNSSPEQSISRMTEYLRNHTMRCISAMHSRLETAAGSLACYAGRLETLSPLAVLARGYTIVRKLPAAKTVRRVVQLKTDDTLELLFIDGSAICAVSNIRVIEPYNLDSQPAEN